MRERDIHKIIEQQESEAKQRIWAKVSEQLDLPPRQTAVKSAPRVKPWKWAAMAMALVCVITLSVVLPLTLSSNDGGDRFCDYENYIIESFDKTLKEYSLANNSQTLYIDWYGIADDVSTLYGYNKKDVTDIIFFTETLVNGETGEILKYSFTDNKTRVDMFEFFYSNTQEFDVNGVCVKWQLVNGISTRATFEYQNHIYYLELDVYNASDRLAEIIEDMLK